MSETWATSSTARPNSRRASQNTHGRWTASADPKYIRLNARLSQLAAAYAVEKENEDPNDKPDEKPFPRPPRQRNHEITGRYHPHRRDEPHCWRLKFPRQVGLADSRAADR